ncbi:MAG: M56 family metallopeptidase [Desulfosporosinus sp.]
MLINIFKQLLIMSVIAGGLYLILKLFSALTLKYFTAAWHYYSNLIMYSFFLVPYYKIVSLFDLNFGPTAENGLGLLSLMGLNQPTVINPAADDLALLLAKSYTAVSFRFDFVPHILMTGTLIFIAVILVQNYRLKRRIFRTCRLAAEEQTLGILFTCKQEMGITREIPVYIVPHISTPFLYGNFKPRIVLPDIKFTAEELQYVFLHELTHWKCHDDWLKYLLLFINAIHWFNPLAYMARHDIDRFCELSCDESVVKSMNNQERRRYCELILNVLWNVADQNTQLFSAFSDKRKHLERRISMILKSEGSKSKKSVRILAIAMTLVISLLGTSAAVYAASETIPQALVQKSSTKLQLTGFVDNINISPVSETANISVQKVKEAPYQQSASPLEKPSLSSVTPRGTTVPTMFWNLATNNYNGSFSGVSTAGIYTNYYFAPNSNNTIYLDERVTGQNSSSQTYKVTLYDQTSGSAVYQNTLTVGDTTWTLTYSGLNSNHFYYVKWEAIGANMFIDGTFTVRQ